MNDHGESTLSGSCTNNAAWPVMICLLGNFRLIRAGERMPIRAGGKPEALLSYLGLMYARRISRERLIQAIWPDSDPALGSHALTNQVYNLHKILGPVLNDAAPVLQENGYCRLNIEAGIGVDVACFDCLTQVGDQQTLAGDLAGARLTYQRAVELYRGDLCLAADTATIVERERLRARYLTLLAQLADYHYRAGNYDVCLEHLWRLLAREPGREDAHRLVMRCYVRRGERAAALRHYQVCADILRAEFGITPESATIALLEQIRDQPGTI